MSSRASRSAALWAGAMPDSGQVRKAVPSCAPLAPSTRAAAIPRPSMRPPLATTGRLTASTTWGTSAIVPTIAASKGPAKVPRCPPASLPCVTMMSTPAASSSFASCAVVAVPASNIPRPGVIASSFGLCHTLHPGRELLTDSVRNMY
jgi:hypothetical protein